MPSSEVPSDYEKAALLVAQGELRYTQIAERVGVSRDTLYQWRQQDRFKQLVASNVEELTEEVRSFGLARLHNRMKHLEDRHRRLTQIIAERGASDEMQGIPGGSTGLLVHDVKAVGGEKVDLYALDAAVLAELRAIEQQAAKEYGQWVDRSEQAISATLKPVAMPEWLARRCDPEDKEESNAGQDSQAG